jgi:hypothetical protein
MGSFLVQLHSPTAECDDVTRNRSTTSNKGVPQQGPTRFFPPSYTRTFFRWTKQRTTTAVARTNLSPRRSYSLPRGLVAEMTELSNGDRR